MFDQMRAPVVLDSSERAGGSDAGSPTASSASQSTNGRIATQAVRLPRMQAVSFESCFGWIHQAGESQGSDTVVLLCSGLARDASTAHRSFRLMADRLASAGYPTLRFDYPGTGDSLEFDGPECWAALKRSVQVAADWLRDRTGARRVVMIGLRAGATLAALAVSARDDVAALVLVEPILRGKSYVGQLLVEARLRSNLPPAPDDDLEIDGLRLGSETIRLLRQVDLRQVKLPPRCAVSVFSQFHTPVLATCLEAWSDTRSPIACHDLLGLEALLRPCHLTEEPSADFTRIVSWLHATTPPRQAFDLPVVSLPGTIALHPTSCTEIPLRFGENEHLFGMLCRPATDTRCDTAVIIGNTGGDPHHGFARFAVEFARRLATQGIASLRIDFAGLGDSITPADGDEGVTRVFEEDRTPDFGAAIDAMSQFGFQQFALSGLCSGAYHAFHGAVADKRVSTLLSINLPWFTLRFEKPGPSSFAQCAMEQLSLRQVRSLLLFSGGDPGLKVVEKHFGPNGGDLHGLPGAVVSIVPGLDHDLTGSAMRRIAANRMIDFLLKGSAIDIDAVSDPMHELVQGGI
jgi:pimeloyl-ACP methyl ester carboxylesterase